MAVVAAGFSPADDYLEAGLTSIADCAPLSTFVLQVSGDSMLTDGIHHGDLLVDRSLAAPAGPWWCLMAPSRSSGYAIAAAASTGGPSWLSAVGLGRLQRGSDLGCGHVIHP